jgi:hypothetical protein
MKDATVAAIVRDKGAATGRAIWTDDSSLIKLFSPSEILGTHRFQRAWLHHSSIG